MALRKEDLIKTITSGLSWLTSQCKLRASLHLFDIHTYSQDFFCQLLNEVYELNLIETDKLKCNFPAIDLGDEAGKRCFQVTSDGDKDKVQYTLDAYVKHGLHDRFGKLQVIVIGERKGRYTLVVPPELLFDWHEDVIDTERLLRIVADFDVEKLERVAAIVRREMSLPTREAGPHPASTQADKVACWRVPIKLWKEPGGAEVDAAAGERLRETLDLVFFVSFGHAWATTPYHDFVFLLTLEKDDRPVESGYVAYLLTLECHVTAFVWAFQEFWRAIEAGSNDLPSTLRPPPSGQKLAFDIRLGRSVPHRIYRDPPAHVVIEPLLEMPIPGKQPVNTSMVLRLVSLGRNKCFFVWDDAQDCPDLAKVSTAFARLNELDRFAWDYFCLDRDNAEAWEFVG